MIEPTIWVALAFSGAHLIAPRLFELRRRFEPRPASFAGGMAVAYIFLHLLPELDVGHEHIGDAIYSLTLVGFCAFYGLEHAFSLLDDESRHRRYFLRMAAACLYNATVVYSLGEQLPTSPLLGALYLGGLSMHLIAMDNGLEEHFGRRFLRSGRALLLASVWIGAVLATVTELHEAVVDVSTAMLAGFLMFNVFRDELPSSEAARYPWFVFGALLIFSFWVALA